MDLVTQIGRRFVGAILTLFGVSVVVFIVLRAIPGDAIAAMLGIESGALSASQRLALEQQYGLNQPVFVQFVNWLVQLVHGDLGSSLISGKSVTSLIGTALPVTVELAILAALIGTIFGIILGTFAGSKPGKGRDATIQNLGLFGLALPEFVLGIVTITVLAQVFHFFPNTGTFIPITQSIGANLGQLIFPALVLSVGFTANIMRTTRSAYLEAATADFVRTARGKGLSISRIRFTHILKNALVPVVTMTGIQFGYLLGGTVVVEEIFALPGLGRLLFTSILNRDYAVVQGCVLVIALFFVAINFVVDLLYQVIDPRVRGT